MLARTPRGRASVAVALIGDLGSGKTTFTKGLAAGLGVREYALVTSPTFVLKQEYEGGRRIHHYDAYRLQGERELLAIGFEEDLASGGVVIVEWADRVPTAVPEAALTVEFEHEVEARSDRRELPGRSGVAFPEDAGRRRLTFRGERALWERPIEEALSAVDGAERIVP